MSLSSEVSWLLLGLRFFFALDVHLLLGGCHARNSLAGHQKSRPPNHQTTGRRPVDSNQGIKTGKMSVACCHDCLSEIRVPFPADEASLCSDTATTMRPAHFRVNCATWEYESLHEGKSPYLTRSLADHQHSRGDPSFVVLDWHFGLGTSDFPFVRGRKSQGTSVCAFNTMPCQSTRPTLL